MKVAVSILSADFTNAWKEVEEIDSKLDYYHMDIMDGVFVPNISFGPGVVADFRKKTSVPFDTHLMISHPKQYIKKFADVGSNMISFHIESKDDPKEVIDLIHSYNVKAGIAIKPNTPVEEIYPVLRYIDYILVMSVEPGFGGQKFMESSLEKISTLNRIRQENSYSYLISVDGGIDNETAKLVMDAGIDFAVVGSYLLDKKNPSAKMEILKNI